MSGATEDHAIASTASVISPEAESLLKEWFGDDLDSLQAVTARATTWFARSPEFDARLRERFATLPDRALNGDLDPWQGNPRSSLALVLALDQLPRNLFRGTARSFAYDATAQETALKAIGRGFDAMLHPVEAVFLYMPFEHAEDLGLQQKSVDLFRALLNRAPPPLRPQFESFICYAERHHAVIERFSRFPHRNATLNRTSSARELEYLESGGERF